MNEETLTALKASIVHWEENVKAECPDEASTGTDSCALCKEFLEEFPEKEECSGCPVAGKTGNNLCRGTPWGEAFFSLHTWHKFETNSRRKQEWQKAAQAELDFLKSLLPEEEHGN